MTSAWTCPACGCRSYARFDCPKPESGYAPGDYVRCVECKREWPWPQWLPDLAEAARPLVERLDKYEADFPGAEEGRWLPVSATDLRALRAALIKAGAQ